MHIIGDHKDDNEDGNDDGNDDDIDEIIDEQVKQLRRFRLIVWNAAKKNNNTE